MKKIYSVHDSKAEYYSSPIVHRNSAEAMRSFEQAAATNDNQINKYPADFTLVEIGVWDEEKARIEPYEHPKILVNASDFAQD